MTLATNTPTQKLARKLGIDIRRDPLDGTVMLLHVALSKRFVDGNR